MSERIDGKEGKILGFKKEGRANIVIIRLEDGRKVEIGIGYLAASEKFNKMSADEMRAELDKPYHGYTVGQKVKISSEEALYG